MSNDDNYDELPSMKGMIAYLKQDILDSAKAHELRSKEVAAIIKGCETGTLTVAKALEQHEKVAERWGNEPLPGISASPGISDEQIIKKIDQVREGQREALGWRSRQAREGWQR